MPRQTSPLHTLARRWPVVLLIASLGLTGFAAFEAQRTGRSNRAVTDRVLRDYSAFVAWAYAQHLEEALRSMAQEAIGAVNHGAALHMSADVPDANDLPSYLKFDPRCQCRRAMNGPNAESYFAFEIASHTLDVAVNRYANPSQGWILEHDMAMAMGMPMAPPRRNRVPSSDGYSGADRDTILRSITQQARFFPDPEHGYTYLTVKLDRGPRLVAYTLMPTVRGDTMVYGLQYSADGFIDVLSSMVRAEELLPEAISAGRRNADLVEVAVRDARGNVLYASDNSVMDDPMASVKLAPRFASLTVLASIKPGQAESLVVGGLPESRMPYLLGLLALAAGLTVVAVMQLRREAELSRVRAEWIASVSHELRTPLAQIRLYLDTLRLGRTADPERQEWALSNVDRETTRLSHLVEKVLSFSRFGRGTAAEPQLCDVRSEVTKIVDEFRPLTATRNVHIETDLQPVPDVALSHDSLRHVLLNLLDNAVKYGPSGQTVRVGVHRVDDDVRVTVQDQGPGVAPSERETVWRPFARGASSREQGGSGIGLTIVREVALQHGGRTWVEGAPGGGARFVVALPIPAPV